MCKSNQSCHTKGQCSKKRWLLGLAFIGVCCLMVAHRVQQKKML